MSEAQSIIMARRSVLAFGVLIAIGMMPILDALTGWPGLEGSDRWMLWAVAPVIWLLTVGAFVSRIRLDEDGIESWTPLTGTRRIAWADVVAVSIRPLVVGTVTTVFGRNGVTIPLTAMHANKDELETIVRERSGVLAP